ncbi:hypothetical protein NDU88_000518 [Pleurodeles waltl]|uniref:Uncharacterized protein n=1 Tax=Pleurodeles waltl TaxID=8319 RepID=A0AAV7URB8_PLEWA|nr:hypothetical protein NDU88_000518 [Pleurodeles waltl]
MRGYISHFLGGVTVAGRYSNKQARQVPPTGTSLPLPTRKCNAPRPIPIYLRGIRNRVRSFAPSPGFITGTAPRNGRRTSGAEIAGESQRRMMETKKKALRPGQKTRQETLLMA